MAVGECEEAIAGCLRGMLQLTFSRVPKGCMVVNHSGLPRVQQCFGALPGAGTWDIA